MREFFVFGELFLLNPKRCF